MEPHERPDPDSLLARVQADQDRARSGGLKVWLGAAPGVGKTFAMLAEAHRLAALGTDVVVGVVETHGRADTKAMLEGLEQIPLRTVEYRGTTLTELDLDAALRRRPAVILVDELAHTNAPSSRYEKRWQDVRALLDAGIAVHTTLNVQHLESLNDVVARITGITVRETVPDAVVDRAGEVELVDLPPDRLLERLHAGKVYVPEAARLASQSFFQRGNLAALRELALRKTAQFVDKRRRDERQESGVRRTRTTGERMLVCVGPSPSSAHLVRAAHRMAAVVRGELHAVSVIRPNEPLAEDPSRDRVLQHLHLAESLGARTATIEHVDAAAAILDYAVRHDCSRILVGKTRRTRLQDALFGSFTMEVIRNSRDMDVAVIDCEGETASTPAAPRTGNGNQTVRARPRDYVLAAAFTVSAVGLALAVFDPPDLSTEAMLLMLAVAATARWCGRWPSLLAALLSALAFNFLMIEPRFTFDIAEPSYLLAFGAMAVIGIGISTLFAAMQESASAARSREDEVAAMLSLTRELADAHDVAEVGRITLMHLRDVVGSDLAMLVAAPGREVATSGLVANHGPTDWLDPATLAVAQWCHLHGKPAGAGTSELPGTPALFVPLRSKRGKEGVLGLRTEADGRGPSPHRRRLVEAFAEQAAAACERIGLAQERARARSEIETERLRSTLLASVSHDLRTPLTTITGSASRLVYESNMLDPSTRHELATSVLAESQRMNELVANLLFATRLQDGAVALRTQWTSLAEVMASALERPPLVTRAVAIDVSPELPLLEVDPVLLEQALFNLLDNAFRHNPPGTHVAVEARAEAGHLVVDVRDDGAGIPADQRGLLFRRFSHGARGLGLGLAISDGIVRAHGGTLQLEDLPAGGTCFRVRLPLPAAQPRLPESEPRP